MARARDRGGRTGSRPGSTAPADVPPPSPVALAVIRLALLLGVLAFGAATTFLVRRGGLRPSPADTLELLRTVGIVLWIVAIAGVVLLRVRGTRLAGRAGPATAAIIGWAIGEAVAIFGGVHYFLSGQPVWYLNGVLFLVATFVVFPLRRSRS